MVVIRLARGGAKASASSCVPGHTIHQIANLNDGKYGNPEVDGLLEAARTELDPAKRRELYGRAFEIALNRDRARLFMWNPKNVMIHTTRLQGYRPIADGLIRLQDMRLQ